MNAVLSIFIIIFASASCVKASNVEFDAKRGSQRSKSPLILETIDFFKERLLAQEYSKPSNGEPYRINEAYLSVAAIRCGFLSAPEYLCLNEDYQHYVQLVQIFCQPKRLRHQSFP
jgi:hypothetical protein